MINTRCATLPSALQILAALAHGIPKKRRIGKIRSIKFNLISKMMRYIIIFRQREAYYTNWFNHDDNWYPDILCVVDCLGERMTFDGKNWNKIINYHIEY